jgi:hypothetical protein
MFPEIMEAAILKTCWTMGPAIGEFHPCISPSCGRDCFRRQRERQSRRQPNPVALSSILNKWRSQMIVIDTDQFRLPCCENPYGFGIWFEFNFPLNDTWSELHNTNQYRFRRFEAD